MQQKQETAFLKMVILGASKVGKSVLLQQYMKERDPDYYCPTSGVDQRSISLTLDKQQMNLCIWDAGGAPYLEKIISGYLRSADGALICFDVTERNSLEVAQQHIKSFKAIHPTAPIILVACKTDLQIIRTVSPQAAQELAQQLGISYLETSGKQQTNIDSTFSALAEHMYVDRILRTIRPVLEKELELYDKTTNNLLREEYNRELQQLFKATHLHQLKHFVQRTQELIQQAEKQHQHNNQFLSLFTSSPLEKSLKQTLTKLLEMGRNINELSYLNVLLAPEQRTLAHKFNINATL